MIFFAIPYISDIILEILSFQSFEIGAEFLKQKLKKSSDQDLRAIPQYHLNQISAEVFGVSGDAVRGPTFWHAVY